MNFLIVNIISVIIFILSIMLIFVSDHLGIGVAFSLLWLLYTIVANVVLLKGKKGKSAKEKLRDSNKRGMFNSQVRALQIQYDSIKSREEFIRGTSDSMQELYDKILEQAESNIDSAAAYIESYDYYTRPNPTYLNKLCTQGDQLVNKFNVLVEQLVDIDTNPTSLDMNYVDDVLECLQEMQTQTMQ